MVKTLRSVHQVPNYCSAKEQLSTGQCKHEMEITRSLKYITSNRYFVSLGRKGKTSKIQKSTLPFKKENIYREFI